MADGDSLTPRLSDLRAAAEQARAALDWDLAITLYSQELEAPGLAPEERYELLDGRAECHRKLSNVDAQLADLQAMERLACDRGGETRRVRSLRLQVRPLFLKGHQARARQAAEMALALARELGQRCLEAESLAELANLYVSTQEWAQSQEHAERALALAREVGDLYTQARCLVAMGYAARSLSLAAQAEGYRHEALDLFRRLGVREEEGNVLSNLGYAATDAAQQRAYYEQALVAYEAAGNRERRYYLYNLLALAYWRLGLYGRARDYAEQAVSFIRELGERLSLVYYLETLARIYLAMGDQERAQDAYEQDLALSRQFRDVQAEWYATFGLGLMALDGGRPSEARDLLHRAVELSVAASSPVDQATNLAWLGAAHLALGEVTAARARTAEAVARLGQATGATGEFPLEDVWWWRYRSLIAPLPSGQTPVAVPAGQGQVGDEAAISDDAWQALDRACAVMLEYVTALSDDGLRRNYLGKAGLNRQIIREWLGQAGRRGQSVAPLTGALTGQGDLQARFQRIVEIGVSLNTRRDAADLPRFIMDEVVELTGAERAVLLLLDENGLQHVAAVAGVGAKPLALWERGWGEGEDWLDSITPFLDEVSLKRAPLLRYLPEGALVLEQRSELCVPLLAQGRLVGLIYVALAGTFGRFTPQDCDLLTVLANQAAVAVENAYWTGTLERRVEERTAELAKATQLAEDARAVAEQANRERGALLDEVMRQNQYLAALHDTTVGLISRLNVNELLEALVTRAGQLIDAPHGFIYLAEPGEAELECKVGVGALSQTVGARRKPGEGLAGKVWQTGEPLVVDDYDRWSGRAGRYPVGIVGAIMGVPLKSGGQVVGAIGLARDTGTSQTFGKEELEFLSRFAQLASVALDNARLYSAAQETQRRMADIIDFLPDATLVIDRDGEVIAWNRAMEEMTGVKAADMLGKGNYEYALPFYGQRRPILIDLVLLPDGEIEKGYAHLQRDGAILMGEALVPQLRGGPAYLYATASALRNSKGEIVGAIETIRDMSDRKRAEEELHQAKAAAESATQAKSAFLATMSHEIRTPMNAVIGMTSLLLDTPLSPEQREFAETIRTSGDALLTVINDILDFSKIEARRIDLDCQPFDVRECVESALGLVAGQASAKGLELGCWIDPQVPAGITGDETRLRQILLNLLSNAVKFTERGEVVVSVSQERLVQSGRLDQSKACELHFSVRDTGLGIPTDRMDRLFQSFSQVDSSTTRKFGGTGLGLAISQRLAELMGGQMWAESAGIPGQGSTFHLTMQAEAAAVPSRAELQAEVPDLHGRRLLIVDDSATSRRILTLQTQGWGMLPQATGSPAEALEWLRRGEAFDVAILDRQMPEVDGVMLAAEVRKLRDAQVLPLVMVSSLGRGEAEETKEFATFLIKPVRASQLYNALVGILAGREARVTRPAVAAPQFDGEMGKRLPLRILLAEDNAVNQKLALRLLERLGYRADVAANGVEVIRAVERQPYDVVFMDVQMPEMDGLEATRQICARWGSGERPRIVAMTANAMREDREACLAAGMDDYLAKPIRVEQLVAALSGSAIHEGH